jgi:hypothetical protein
LKAAVLGFAALALACAAACVLAGSARLLGPFVASIGVICSAATPASRLQAGAASFQAHGLCALLGLAAHALLPALPVAAVGAALVGFVLLRALGRPHAPALALLAVLAMGGASVADLAGALAMAAALWLGALGWSQAQLARA